MRDLFCYPLPMVIILLTYIDFSCFGSGALLYHLRLNATGLHTPGGHIKKWNAPMTSSNVQWSILSQDSIEFKKDSIVTCKFGSSLTTRVLLISLIH
ncbi:hypothetical protein KIN20_001564 [Parelaphostrongylus tenuis]|uniref:Uncharacterized protein n=1 Tax=Parelaphostrongylus tenuis TaxID=148309 RepID=A0AAD5QH20_PARTN|nr:hypothetical protein KIN20_001564 [Parelaphostrongylus tenuis]